MLLACDVAFANFGVVVIDKGEVIHAETIQTKPAEKKRKVRSSDDNAERAAHIATRLNEIIKEYDIKAAVAELPHSGGENVKSAMGIAMAIGVLVGVIESNQLPVEWATPDQVKKTATGIRSATKLEMMTAAITDYGGCIEEKKIANGSVIRKFHFGTSTYTAGVFEHIADAYWVYKTLSAGNVVKIFG